jgi:hypothetical protein
MFVITIKRKDLKGSGFADIFMSLRRKKVGKYFK